MFYNALIQAFLADDSLFSDVKAIVDCPLRVDPSEVVKACRERDPKDILELLDAPGSDLDHPKFEVPPECREGHENFLKCFDKPAASPRTATLAPLLPRSATSTRRQSSFTHIPLRVRSSLGGRNGDNDETPASAEKPKLTLAESKLIEVVARGAGMLTIGTRRDRRRATASTMWASHLGDIMDEYAEDPMAMSKKDKVLAARLISEEAKQTVLEKYHRRLKKLGSDLVNLWPKFYRQISPQWSPDRNSLIPLPCPFIVPGGRFIEIYYWDSYWILLGVLATGLFGLAQDMIENFLFCIERYGFMPNGARKYYLDRSQPPLLSCMLRAYYRYTGDLEFIRNALPILEREYAFWMSVKKGHCVEVEVPDKSSSTGTKTAYLNRYYSLETTPRPESYRIDDLTGKLYEEFNGAASSKAEHFRAIRAGAESGWDFSSRWLRPAVEGQAEQGIKPDIEIDKVLHKLCLIDIDTCQILPCDLNGFMFAMEEDLAFFADLMGKHESYQCYMAARELRREAMLQYLWDPEREFWLDYDIATKKLSCVISAASFVPLWAGVNYREPINDERRVQLASRLSCLIRPYGVVATNITAGLQWDAPNVWAPSHHMAVDFLAGGRFWDHHKSAKDDHGPAMAIAINWASRFINTVLDRFEFFGTCSEKYDCARLGKSGADGEYVTQEGFGWTNGTVLDFMAKFGNRLVPAGLYTSRRDVDETFSRASWL